MKEIQAERKDADEKTSLIVNLNVKYPFFEVIFSIDEDGTLTPHKIELNIEQASE